MITDFENTLRRIIIEILGSDDSSEYKVSIDRINKWKEKREIELKKQKGLLREKRLLYYSDFYDLQSIVLKNWELFNPIFNDKKRFEVFFSEVETFRNSVAHGRSLTSSQENLLSEIYFDFKNKITIYHNKNEMIEDYFIRIIKIDDNLGNTWDKGKENIRKKPILKVGDFYELTIEASDPKERKIKYRIFDINNKINISQNSNRFNFVISNVMVNANYTLYVEVFTPDSEYKNNALGVIDLTVLPY